MFTKWKTKDLKYTAITLDKPKYKSKMHVGNVVVMNTKHFNWFQKKMWKILLGIKIEDYKEESI